MSPTLPAGDAPLHLLSAAGTDIGLVRRVNEDSFLQRPGIGLWAVADGMGGHHAGDRASAMVIDALREIGRPADARELLEGVRRQLQQANACIRRFAADHFDGSVMASTVVCLLIHGGYYACVWAGDSRLYLLRDEQLMRVSHDHSRVQALIDNGSLLPEEARHSPIANQVTRAVGAADLLQLGQMQGRIEPHDRFLLCSDGLTGPLSDEELAEILVDDLPSETPQATVQRLIARALERGGRDNVTAVLVRCAAGPLAVPVPPVASVEEDEPTAVRLRRALSSGEQREQPE